MVSHDFANLSVYVLFMFHQALHKFSSYPRLEMTRVTEVKGTWFNVTPNELSQ